ncbi:MAG TPA: SDR family oxidoreductase [Methanocella sp.]|nr:SDR family oxidoreductase [Methanocella sp.]
MKAELLKTLGLKPDDLAGRVAVVTGAGQGIGKELSLALSMIGASVVLAEIKDTGAEVESQIRAAGGRALFVKTDVSDEGSVRRLFEQSIGMFGRVDILVNNAVTTALGSVLELPVAAWDRAYTVNLKGPVLLIRAFLPPMLDRKSGVVVNVLSSEGLAYLAPYSASKAALQSLTSSLVLELGEGKGVAVLNFGPGMIDTPTMTETVRSLAPRMGMTYDQFTHLGVNPGYDGLMPAEDCAAGFAYIIVHAGEYHGQTADAFKPLIQAGILSGVKEPETQPHAHEKPLSRAPVGTVTAGDAISLSKDLREVLAAVNKETEELDLFKRTWVRNDFNRKVGMSIRDSIVMGDDLIRDLEDLERGNGNVGVFKGKVPYYIARLEKLSVYFSAQVENARGYFKDPTQRELAIAALAQRESAARRLAQALKSIEP